MVHAEVFKPRLPGILEPADIARAGDAVFVVALDRGDVAADIGDRGDRALVVGGQKAQALSRQEPGCSSFRQITQAALGPRPSILGSILLTTSKPLENTQR